MPHGARSRRMPASREPVGVEGSERDQEVDAAGAVGSVCVGCGLCCDGTVVSHLAVSDASDLGPPLLAMGVEVIAEADPPVFALPCPAVDDGVCTVYELHRPHACAQFQCALSTAVDAGATTPAAARAIVLEGRRLQIRGDDRARGELRALIERYFLHR